MKTNIVFFGSSGHLGVHLKKEFEINKTKFNIYYASKKDVENILKDKISKDFLEKSFFINLVSIVGTENISKFSDNYINKINSLFPLKLAKLCCETNSKLIHISSNSVFENSQKRYRYDYVEMKANTVYGKSKLIAENYIKNNLESNSYLILRTPQQYSSDLVNKRNLFSGIYEKLKNYKKVEVFKNEIFSIASCESISRFIVSSINKGIKGTYNLSEPLEYNWIHIATLLINKMNLNINKSLIIKFENNSKQKNSTLYPSSIGLLKSNLNELL